MPEGTSCSAGSMGGSVHFGEGIIVQPLSSGPVRSQGSRLRMGGPVVNCTDRGWGSDCYSWVGFVSRRGSSTDLSRRGPARL